MSKKDTISEEWRVRARVQYRRDVTDLNREWSGVQGNRMHRFTTGFGGADLPGQDEKEKDESGWYEFYLEQMTEDYRRSYERLARTIQEAEIAYLLALEDIQRQKEEAALQLEDIRANALVLSDGRRVYFTRDGSKLFDDDGQEVTEQNIIEEAREEQERNPNASSHEDNTEAKDNFQTARDKEEEIFKKLQELEELKTRMEKGEMTQGELDAKTQEIMEGMSPEVRKTFARVRGVEADVEDNPVSVTTDSSAGYTP